MLTELLTIVSCLTTSGSVAHPPQSGALREEIGVHTRAPAQVALAQSNVESARAPTSASFRTLAPLDREAVERFFATGPGAVPDGGTIDAGTSTWRRDRVPGYPGLFHITIGNTGSGYIEKLLLQIPDAPPSGARPMLVVFHKFGVSHMDVLVHTDFIAEARARDWYLVAPLGAKQNNFGSLPSQINVRAALDLVLGWLPIDRQRIYGVGFSMGGGGCTSYAARHLDPAGAMFAAIVNHTGTVSLAHVHANESAEVRGLLEGWFNGPPAADPFAYQRCSAIDLDPATNSVGPDTDMARNLGHVAIHNWIASEDPQPYLPAQTDAFHAHVLPMNPADELTVVDSDIHDWSTLDEAEVCSWLATHALPTLTSGSTLADEDGVWHRFVVEQDAPGSFTPIDWSVDVGQNRIDLLGTANLRRLTVDAHELGLVYTGSLRLNLSTADATGDQVLLLDMPHAPNAVFRNGVPAAGTYDGLTDTFLLTETGSAPAQWVIVF